jgi:Tol biopolymer transport system component
MNMRVMMIPAAMALVLCLNMSAQENPPGFYPKIFWGNNMDRGVILVSPTEMLLMDSMGVKYGKVFAKDSVVGVFMSPDGKKLIYTAASKIWLVKIENGETQLVANGICSYLRWNPDGLSFLFVINEYGKDGVPGWVSMKLFWADGDGKNVKQVYP